MGDTSQLSGDGGGGITGPRKRRRTPCAGPRNRERTRFWGSSSVSASVAAATRSKAMELPRELGRGRPGLSGLRYAATPNCEERLAGLANATAPISNRPQNRVVKEVPRGVSELVKNSASNSCSRDSNTSASSRGGKEEQVSDNDRNGNATSLPKKRKCMNSRKYLKLFKSFKRASARDIVVVIPDRVGKENTPRGSVADDNIVMPCEGALLIEKNKNHSSNAVYKGLQPSNEGLLTETTLIQNVVPPEPISTQPMQNDPVEISVYSGRGPASEALCISENNIRCSPNGVGLENVGSSNPIPANNDSISQEPSIKECRNTEHVEEGNISNPAMSLGNATLPVRESNANGDGTLDSDQVRLELPILASQILTTAPVYREIGVHANLSTMSAPQSVPNFRYPPIEAEPTNISSMPPQQSSDLSAQRNLVSSDCPLAEAERTDMLDTQVVQDLQPEMEPSISMQDQSEQPALVHAEPAGAEGPNVLDIMAAPSEERGQIGFQTNTHSPEQPTQLLPPDTFMFDHHPFTSTEPLKNELERIKCSAISASKAHEQKRSLFLIEYNQEMEKIRSKYELLLQKEDSAYLQRKAMLASIHKKVAVHQLLAEKFRQMFNGYSPAQVASRSPVMEQALHFSSSARPPVLNPFPLPGPHFPSSLIAQPSPENARVQSILHGNLYVPPGSYGYAGAQPHLPHTRSHHQLIRTQSPYDIHTNRQQQLHLPIGQQQVMAAASSSQQGLGSFSLQYLEELLGNFPQPPSPNPVLMMAGQSNQNRFFHSTLGSPNATQMAGVGQSGYGSTSSDMRRPGNVTPVIAPPVTCISDDE